MEPAAVEPAQSQLILEPTRGVLAVAYGFLAVFGGAAACYGVAVGCFMLTEWSDKFRWWEVAFIAGMPLLFAAVLAWWVLENRHPFRLDQERGQLFSGKRPVLALEAIQAVAVVLDPGETCDLFRIDLVLKDGSTFALRQHWWPMDRNRESARCRAQQIADFLGVELHEAAASNSG